MPRLERFRVKYPQITLRIQANLAVTHLQQEGADLAIRMGKGDWEGTRVIIFSPMNLSLWLLHLITAVSYPVRRQR